MSLQVSKSLKCLILMKCTFNVKAFTNMSSVKRIILVWDILEVNVVFVP
jgi:hypothetical protein